MSTSLSTLTTTTTMLLFILTSGIIQPTHATVSNCYTQSNVTVICEFPGHAVDPDCKVSNLACPPTECLVGYTREEWFCDRWQGWGCSYAVCGVFFGGAWALHSCFWFFLLDSLANEFLGGIFLDLLLQGRMWCSETSCLRKFLQRLFSLYMTRNVYLGSICSFFLSCSGELRIVQIVPVMRGLTNNNGYNARIFFLSLSIQCLLVSSVFWVGAGGKLSWNNTYCIVYTNFLS